MKDSVKKFYYHKNCPDGIASALIAHAYFTEVKQDVEYIELQYNTKEQTELKPEHGQMFVDITPPVQRWREWFQYHPIVLDHHETAKDVVNGLKGVYGLNETHSGAKLAFEYLFNDIPDCNIKSKLAEFSELAMIRDTWKKDDVRFKDACDQASFLTTFGFEWIVKNGGLLKFIDDSLNYGRLFNEKRDHSVKKYAKGAYFTDFNHGCEVYKIAITSFSDGGAVSDVGSYLINSGINVYINFNIFVEDDSNMPVCLVSLRSDGLVKVNEVAKKLGGGGHDKAAGFKLPNALSMSVKEIWNIVTSNF